jgi:hypothetical protein
MFANSIQGTDCDSDHYRKITQISYGEVYFQEIKSGREGQEQFRVEISNRFAALEDLDPKVEINSAWETIRENIKISAKESLGYFELKHIREELRQRMFENRVLKRIYGPKRDEVTGERRKLRNEELRN